MNIEFGRGWYFFSLFVGRIEGYCIGRTYSKKYFIVEVAISRPKYGLQKCWVLTKHKEHKHDFKLQYQTGSPYDGKSDVVKCSCGQWAVYHRDPSNGETHKYIMLE